MIAEMFTVFDMAAQQYLEPFMQPTIEAAIRVFRQACENPEHQFGKFPEDYVMYKVGTFDGSTGEVVGCEMTKVAMAVSYSGGFGNQLEMEA